MPKPITAYECIHGCGRFLKTYRIMERHEDACLCNLANRTCRTCLHDEKLTMGKFACGAGVEKGGEKIIRHCPQWVDLSDERA